MADLAYLAGTLAFFALMIAYVHLCERLGRPASAELRRDASRAEDAPR